mmetsp:Transcript_40648/g.102323  ORF Transcript_40648/g.102323 Transcript_40648/m.102323 type:complete len:133 (+) Transcript_40648:282-680(+)
MLARKRCRPQRPVDGPSSPPPSSSDAVAPCEPSSSLDGLRDASIEGIFGSESCEEDSVAAEKLPSPEEELDCPHKGDSEPTAQNLQRRRHRSARPIRTDSSSPSEDLEATPRLVDRFPSPHMGSSLEVSSSS